MAKIASVVQKKMNVTVCGFVAKRQTDCIIKVVQFSRLSIVAHVGVHSRKEAWLTVGICNSRAATTLAFDNLYSSQMVA